MSLNSKIPSYLLHLEQACVRHNDNTPTARLNERSTENLLTQKTRSLENEDIDMYHRILRASLFSRMVCSINRAVHPDLINFELIMVWRRARVRKAKCLHKCN